MTDTLTVQSITIADKAAVEELYSAYGRCDSAHAFASLFLWKQDMDLSLYMTPDVYTVRSGWKGENSWFYPCGKPEARLECVETLMEKQRSVLPEMIRELCADPEGMWNNAAAQDETAAEYWPCPTEEDWTITDGMDEDCVERVLRAFYGYEVIYKTKGEKWELIRALLKDTEEENAVCFPFGRRVICAMKARKLQ